MWSFARDFRGPAPRNRTIGFFVFADRGSMVTVEFHMWCLCMCFSFMTELSKAFLRIQ